METTMSEDNGYLSQDEIRGLIGSCNTPDGFYQETVGFRAICTVDDPGEKLPLTYKVAGGSVESKHYDESEEKEKSEILAEANGSEGVESDKEVEREVRAEALFEAEGAEALQEVFGDFVERVEPYDFELVENHSE